MPENHQTGDHQTSGEQPTAPGVPESKPLAPGNSHPQIPAPEGEQPKHDTKPPQYPFWKRIRWLDVTNTVIAIIMAVVAYETYSVTSDTSYLKRAIENIADLAKQTKRQADASNSQVGQIRREADALSAQVEQMKRQTIASETLAKSAQGQLVEDQAQTRAISAQTSAIKASSDANMRSAQAQKRMADVTAQAQKPDVDLNELTLSGLKGTPSKDGTVTVSLNWAFRNSGGSELIAKRVLFGFWTGDSLPKDIPMNGLGPVDGADMVVTPTITSGFSLKKPIQFPMVKFAADGISSGKVKFFFIAVFEYADKLGEAHKRCFGRQFIFDPDGNSNYSVPAGGPAYHCNT